MPSSEPSSTTIQRAGGRLLRGDARGRRARCARLVAHGRDDEDAGFTADLTDLGPPDFRPTGPARAEEGLARRPLIARGESRHHHSRAAGAPPALLRPSGPSTRRGRHRAPACARRRPRRPAQAPAARGQGLRRRPRADPHARVRARPAARLGRGGRPRARAAGGVQRGRRGVRAARRADGPLGGRRQRPGSRRVRQGPERRRRRLPGRADLPQAADRGGAADGQLPQWHLAALQRHVDDRVRLRQRPPAPVRWHAHADEPHGRRRRHPRPTTCRRSSPPTTPRRCSPRRSPGPPRRPTPSSLTWRARRAS